MEYFHPDDHGEEPPGRSSRSPSPEPRAQDIPLRRGKYSYLKCVQCRKDKKKCEPEDRDWPAICNRCTSLGLPCSPPGTTSRENEKLRRNSPKASKMPVPAKSKKLGNDESHAQRKSRIRARILSAAKEQRRLQGPPSMYGVASEVLQRIRSLRNEDTTATAHRASPPLPALCETCGSLGLSKENFLVHATGMDIKSEQDGLVANAGRWAGSYTPCDNPSQAVTDTLRRRPSRPQYKELGDLKSIQYKSQRCAFCDIIWKSVKDQLSETDINLRETLGFATWKVDGRSVSKTFNITQPLTRHIKLYWNTDRLRIAYVVLVGNDLRIGKSSRAFLGRRISQGWDIFGLIQDWVRQCGLLHDSCKTTLWGGLPSMFLNSSTTVHPVFVVNVRETRITPFRPDMSYVALSFKWTSDSGHFRLTKANFLQRQVLGMNEEINGLPLTIKDAMEVTKNIGFKYIWVEPLCIIHDAENDTAKMLSTISEIYAHASLTICAASARQETSGLGLQRPGPDSQIILRRNLEESFMLRHPAESYIGRSEWNSGMWTFQHRYLSRRCLIFSEGRVWFQCLESSMSEDIFEPSFPGWSSDMLRSPGQTWNILRLPGFGFSAYTSCVELYTQRQLEYDKDILLPLRGVMKVFKAHLKTDFVYGLPVRILDLAMLWSPSNSSCSLNEQQTAPSWSWAGWIGSINYDKSALEGVVDDVLNWTEEHTWIFWFWRDEQNKVFPVKTREDMPSSRNNGSEELITGRLRAQLNVQSLTPAVKKTKKWPILNQESLYKILPIVDTVKIETTPLGIGVDIAEHRPGTLNFWTWSAFFCLECASAHADIKRYNILDRCYEICGSIVLPQTFINNTKANGTDEIPFEFIAISEAKTFTQEEMPIWTQYTSEERENSHWNLWYVILVQTIGSITRRVAVGKVYIAAFYQSFHPGMDWREFTLS